MQNKIISVIALLTRVKVEILMLELAELELVFNSFIQNEFPWSLTARYFQTRCQALETTTLIHLRGHEGIRRRENYLFLFIYLINNQDQSVSWEPQTVRQKAG